MMDADTKVQAAHRKRNAYLYIRQSTPRQVLEHQESTQRQYGLRQQALRLGWCLPPFSVPAQRLRWCADSAGKVGCFPGISAAGRITSRCCGNSFRIHSRQGFCTIRDTPARLSTDGRQRATQQMANVVRSGACPWTSGRWSSRTPIQDI
jgi:hypothetical protein